MGNYYARFGGGRMEKGLKGHLASRLPYSAPPDQEFKEHLARKAAEGHGKMTKKLVFQA